MLVGWSLLEGGIYLFKKPSNFLREKVSVNVILVKQKTSTQHNTVFTEWGGNSKPTQNIGLTQIIKKEGFPLLIFNC